MQPHPKEKQKGVRGPGGALDPAAHPKADAEVRDAQRPKNEGRIKGGAVPSSRLLLFPFVFSPKTCRNATKKEAAVRARREAERWAGRAGPWCWPPVPSLSLSRYDDK